MSRAAADALMAVFGYGPGQPVVEFTVPVRTVSEANGRDHWRVKAKRTKQHRRWAAALCPRHALPCVVTMTRLSAGELDDDNLRSALKAVRDGIADALGVDDRDPRVRWEYGQAKCKRGEFGVRVTIMALEPRQTAQEARAGMGAVSTLQRDERPSQGHTGRNRGGAR